MNVNFSNNSVSKADKTNNIKSSNDTKSHPSVTKKEEATKSPYSFEHQVKISSKSSSEVNHCIALVDHDNKIDSKIKAEPNNHKSLEINNRVKAVISEHLGVDANKVKPQANIGKDLGADDLDKVEVVMALEEEFGIEIPEEKAAQFATVGQFVSYIQASIPKY